ncbi:MAG: GuaB1 family IMP dehydrogenase-related protein [Myxococcota bacterium]|nr:GuaB1 family IMP dehydrogenase-related protein [Myxococcota bacterium]
MKFLHPEHDQHLELSLDDVFILPQFHSGQSRLNVNLTPLDGLGGAHPLVSANMNAVTGKRMAETMARFGGLGILPQDMDLSTVERIVASIKTSNIHYDTPLTVTSDATLRDVLGIIRKRSHDLVVVVDQEHRVLGIISHADLRDKDQYTSASLLMSKSLVKLRAGVSNREAFNQLMEHRVKGAPVVDKSGQLIGVLTRDDSIRTDILTPNLDTNQRFKIGAAVGISADAAEQAEFLVKIGVDHILLDTAHGHQKRMLDAIKDVRKAIGPSTAIIAGNVCTRDGTLALLEAGADIAKVNVGPGAMCTTRMQTGVGRPTFTSAKICAEAALSVNKYIWADGGVRHGRDAALYLAAGAGRVMVGTTFAGTFESPGDIKEDKDGRLFKENYGMASARAVRYRNSTLDPFEQAKKALFKEGISNSRIYLRQGEECIGSIITNFITGIQSALTYTGSSDLKNFHQDVTVGVQTASGFHEGTPHGKVRN